MKIVIDDKIPFIAGVLEPYAEVRYIKGSEITSAHLSDTDALLIRTRTSVNKDLPGASHVKFIGTATIGTDHIDTAWCHKNNIYVASAPGCNSGSVMQYIAASLSYLNLKYDTKNSLQTIGIIGLGNVGKKVAAMATELGFKVLLNDPPRQAIEGDHGFCDIEHLLAESDIITLHIPLTMKGDYPTYQMVDNNFLKKTKRGSVIINTSRGPVIEENALIAHIKQQELKATILDVWCNEPDINIDLLKLVDIATPHIAGYSVDGKANGTATIVNKLASWFDLPLKNWKPEVLPQPSITSIEADKAEDAILATYPITEDSNILKESPERFEELRGNYRIRREFGNYMVKGKDLRVLDILNRLGFNTNK